MQTQKPRRRRRWRSGQQVHCDAEQAAILASFNVHRFRRLQEEQLEYINDANFEHAVKISRLSSTLSARPRWPPTSKLGSPRTRRLASGRRRRGGSTAGQRRRRPCSTARWAKQGWSGGHGCTRGRTTTRQARHALQPTASRLGFSQFEVMFHSIFCK
jgi:hypothetical protein